MPRTLVARLIEEFRQRDRRRPLFLVDQRGVELTSWEWEILELMRQGLTTAQIAERLFISKVTVRTHIAAILKKLRIPARPSALRWLGSNDHPLASFLPPAGRSSILAPSSCETSNCSGFHLSP